MDCQWFNNTSEKISFQKGLTSYLQGATLWVWTLTFINASDASTSGLTASPSALSFALSARVRIGTRRRTEGRHDEGRYQGMGQHEGAIAGGRKEARADEL
jgi:hypothetical protein